MLLAVNIGNSNIRFGVFKSEEEIISWTVNTKPYRTEDECYAKFKGMYKPFNLDKRDITDVVIGSVVPTMTQAVFNALKRIHKIAPMVVDRDTPCGIKHSSTQMGTDIYANAVAAYKIYNKKHMIVIDFGTALTFVSVDDKGQSGGAVIAPGVNTALNSLVGETAQLHEVELKAPERVLGFTTESCIQSGMVYGFLSLVEGMIDRINKESGEKCYVISTGGLGFIFEPLTDKINVYDRFHTLKGLKILYELNME